MSHQIELSKDLSVEDFRRLGVRPNEVRLSVIRSAAARNAMPLANQLLATPNQSEADNESPGDVSGDDSWLQLSRVVTSTYRLLDPRLRPNSHQRAYVGRILPLALSAASTTRFHSIGHQGIAGQKPVGQSLPTNQSLNPSPVPPPVSDIFRNPDIPSLAFDPANTQLNDAEIWQLSLDDRDSVSGNRLRRHRNTANRNFRIGSLMVALGIAAGTLLGWNSLSKKTATADPTAEVNAVHPVDPTAVPSTPVPSITPRLGDPEFVASNAGTEATNAFPAPTTIAQQDSHSTHGTAVPTASETETPIEAAVAPPTIDAITNRDNTAPSANAPILKAPILKAPIAESPIAESPTPKANPTVEQRLFPAPQPEDVAIARKKLLQSINASSINRVNFKTVRDWTADAQTRFSPGSLDHFTSASMLASFAWLEPGTNQPSLSNMTARLDAYEVDETKVWTQSYVDASQHITLPEDLNRFFIAGFGLTETLIKHEALEQAKEVLTVIQQRHEQYATNQANNIGSRENDIRTLIVSHQKSLKYADRLSTTAHRMIRLHGEVESIPTNVSGSSSLGRYYCLVLGDWSQGLRFLAQTSDPRLAALAKSELKQLAVDPFVDDPNAWSEIANQWNLAADRLSGRSTDQLRLHAIDLLNRSSDRSTAVAKLHAMQQIEVIRQQLPIHLKWNQESANATPQIAVAASEETAPNTEPPSKPNSDASGDSNRVNDWLIGRISVDGEDLGIRLRYQLEVGINQSMLESIERQLRRSLSDATIELKGDFNCKEDQWIVVSVSPPLDTISDSTHDSAQRNDTIQIDGEPIELDSTDNSARLLIPQGSHSLRWQINLAASQTTWTCSLRNMQTGKRLKLETSAKQVGASSSGDLSVSVMRSGD